MAAEASAISNPLSPSDWRPAELSSWEEVMVGGWIQEGEAGSDEAALCETTASVRSSCYFLSSPEKSVLPP